MTKRIVTLVLLLALLATALPAHALTNAEKYDAALQGMIGYLSGDGATTPGDLFAAFSACGSYRNGASMALYAKVLASVEKGDYSMVYPLIRQLRANAAFGEYLAETEGLGTLDELESYVSGREAEQAGDTALALECYGRCPSFADGETRFYALSGELLEGKYQEALRLYALDTPEDYARAAALFGELAAMQYRDAADYLAVAQLMMVTPEPTASPTPEPTPTPAPTATPAPVTLVEGLNYLGGYWVRAYSDGTCVITGKSSVGNKEVIPAVLTDKGTQREYRVTAIGADSFNDFDFTYEVTIPMGVTSIGDRAFEGCNRLRNVSIPPSVTSIGERAFGGCSVLGVMMIPSGVTRLGDGAFEDCRSLDVVIMEHGLTSIGNNAFAGCKSLSAVTIPASVTGIGNRAFWHCFDLSNVTIPEGVTHIGDEAFSGCTGLRIATLPASVNHIGKDAFGSCSKLTLRVPAGSCAEQYAKDNSLSYITYGFSEE